MECHLHATSGTSHGALCMKCTCACIVRESFWRNSPSTRQGSVRASSSAPGHAVIWGGRAHSHSSAAWENSGLFFALVSALGPQVGTTPPSLQGASVSGGLCPGLSFACLPLLGEGETVFQLYSLSRSSFSLPCCWWSCVSVPLCVCLV